ncbi:MAG: ATP-binding protein [Candidatus Diapherotrites archaeon]|nr:ATP-binding protein [Candidatus Diapherotrites archaeon]
MIDVCGLMNANEDYLGIVISTPDSPNTERFCFVLTSKEVRKGQFVKINSPEGTILSLVVSIYKTNKYFERADSVKEFELRGTSILEQFPTSEWEYTVAEAKLLSIFSEEKAKRVYVPPMPGSKVYSADNSLLESFYQMDKNGLYLGDVEANNLPVILNMTKLLKKHLAILSISGAGKSYCASVLFEELLDRKKDLGRIACVVFDPHGEYTSFAEPAEKGYTDYSSKTVLIKGSNIRIGVSNLSPRVISIIASSLSTVQRRTFDKTFLKLKEEMHDGSGPFDLKDLIKEIKDSKIQENTKEALLSWLEELDAMHLFSKTDSPGLSNIAQAGKLTVVDLSDIIDVRKKQMILCYFSQELFSLRCKGKIPPFLLIIEESHQFCPEKTKEENAISRSIIRTIAREGRKFGACLCLISQRPVQLDTTALSQCNTKIILRITNPYDLKHIAQSAEAIDQISMDMITSLHVGEALLIGEAVGYPLFFKVRKRRSMPSKHEQTLEEAAIKFEKNKLESDNEAHSFL